jgi:hypothetical protein
LGNRERGSSKSGYTCTLTIKIGRSKKIVVHQSASCQWITINKRKVQQISFSRKSPRKNQILKKMKMKKQENESILENISI